MNFFKPKCNGNNEHKIIVSYVVQTRTKVTVPFQILALQVKIMKVIKYPSLAPSRHNVGRNMKLAT